jgi:hypothetical protein
MHNIKIDLISLVQLMGLPQSVVCMGMHIFYHDLRLLLNKYI